MLTIQKCSLIKRKYAFSQCWSRHGQTRAREHVITARFSLKVVVFAQVKYDDQKSVKVKVDSFRPF